MLALQAPHADRLRNIEWQDPPPFLFRKSTPTSLRIGLKKQELPF